jgi:hypothetical protein
MSVTRPKTQPIPIRVVGNQIELGERYASAVSLYSPIEWTCDHPFDVRFDWDAPFELQSKGKNSLTMRFKAGTCLMPNHAYTYAIAAFAGGKVLTTTAIIIVKPPQPTPLPKQAIMALLPGIIIVKPPKP